MKFKVLFSAMLALGLVSSAAMADTAAAKVANSTAVSAQPAQYGTDAIWNSVIDRTADNAYGEVALYAGQTEVTGQVITDFRYRDYSTTYGNSPSLAQFSLYSAELYVDSQFNSWIRAHIAVTYGSDFTGNASSLNTTPSVFFDEAYVTLYNGGDFYAKVGRQYLNFGSTAHQSISTPLPQVLSSVNAVAVTAGAVKIADGLYADASVFNGGQYGTPGSTTYNNSKFQANGVSVDLGYTQQMANQGYNVYVDYINNLTNAMNVEYAATRISNTSGIVPNKMVGGVAVHADYHTGPFTVMGDYVSALTKFDPADWSYNGAGARPAAYSAEADYNFITLNHPSTATLGYAGSSQMAGVYSIGAAMPTPQSRLLAAYSYYLMSHVYLEAEYDHDQDYGTNDTSDIGNGMANSGTNGDDNTLTLRLKVLF